MGNPLNILGVNPRFSSLFSVILLAIASAGKVAAAPVDVPATLAPAAPPVKIEEKSGGKLQEIQVTLFGQPCTMSGPFPKTSLTLLHEVSPEKIPPDLTTDQMKRVRAKTGELKSMPMPIEQYRDHLRKRLSAKIAFEEAVAQAKKAKGEMKKSLETVLTNLKEHISTLQYSGFADATKKSFETSGSAWNEAFTVSFRERFEGVIQPDTEEEFHKSIRLAKIQYVCAFDDSDHKGDEDYEE